MPGPGDPPERQQAPIIGREAGLARLHALVDPVPQASQVLVVIGEAGMGKTVLLADAAGLARSAGMRVLSVTGRESESRLAFAGLHQLLRPVLSSVTGLPGRQAQALSGALGLAADPGAADPLLTGVAVLTLLSDLSERSPVLVVADDVHWLDRSSLEALAFAGSRLDAERVVLLVGARGQAPPPGFDRGFPELHLEPLSADDAGRLLDGQPRPPRGRARAQVLAQAAGNPMALIELAKVIADDPAASRRWAAEPLPPTDRLTAVLTSRFATLPEQTQAALLLAAVADGPDLSAAAAIRAGPATPRLRRMAAAAPPDQRRQARPERGPGHLPAARCPVMGAAGAGRAESVRGGRYRRVRRTRRPRGTHPPAAPDRPAGQRRPDQPRDWRPALPVTAHRQLAPVPVLSQARGRRPPPATRLDHPRQHANHSTRKHPNRDPSVGPFARFPPPDKRARPRPETWYLGYDCDELATRVRTAEGPDPAKARATAVLTWRTSSAPRSPFTFEVDNVDLAQPAIGSGSELFRRASSR